jgi:1-acyl-sn-glycerol-3-phosphate acyltransferase
MDCPEVGELARVSGWRRPVLATATFLANLARTLYFFVAVVFWTGLVGYLFAIPPAIVQRLLRRRGAQLAHTVLYHGVRFCSLPWRLVARISIDDRHRVADGRAVVISNHHSYIDIFLLFHVFPRIRMTARPTLFRIPFLGWAMSLLEHIPHAAERPDEALEQAKWFLDRGTFVGFFPEGTRAPTGQVGPFQRGAFRLAQMSTEQVQPVVVVGSGRVWARGQAWIRALGPVALRVLPPVAVPRTAGREELKRIVTAVHALMSEEHRRLEAEVLGADGVSPVRR